MIVVYFNKNGIPLYVDILSKYMNIVNCLRGPDTKRFFINGNLEAGKNRFYPRPVEQTLILHR
jgi:hypothetical protein